MTERLYPLGWVASFVCLGFTPLLFLQSNGVGYRWLDDRIAIRDVFDDVGSKYVPLHVNIFYCLAPLGGRLRVITSIARSQGLAFWAILVTCVWAR